MAYVHTVLKDHLTNDLAYIVDSFFTIPKYWADSYKIGLEGHPEHVISYLVGWPRAFEGILDAGFDELAATFVTFITTMYTYTIPLNDLLQLACRYAKVKLAAELVKAGATYCDYCHQPPYSHRTMAMSQRPQKMNVRPDNTYLL